MNNSAAEEVFKTFCDIDQGLYTNASFSHANVVLVSKELYYTLLDSHERLAELETNNEKADE